MSLKQVISFWKSPYPSYGDLKFRVIFALLAGSFVGAFLIVFQPFGTYNFQHPHKTWLLAGYGAVTSVVLLLWAFVFHVFDSAFIEKSWTLWKQIVLLMVIVLGIALGSYLYFIWFFGYGFKFYAFKDFIVFVSGISIFPIAFITVADLFYKKKKFENISSQIKVLAPRAGSDTALDFSGEGKSEFLSVQKKDFLFLKSSGNYVEVFYGKGQSKVLRNKMKSFLHLMDESIIQTHKSYLVNLSKVESVKGNSQGLIFSFKDASPKALVARGNVKKVRQMMSELAES